MSGRPTPKLTPERRPEGAMDAFIGQMSFRPRNFSIRRGTVVRWVNRGDRSHTTTSDTSIWDSNILSPGDTFRRRFRRAGTFRYHCEIHAGMTATITVN